jgi:transposase-like protein
MKRNCPKKHCKSHHIIKHGTYKRRDDSRVIQRYKCKRCGSIFSSATGTLEFQQRKRRVNYLLFKLFASKISIKQAARIVGVNKNTAAKKFDYWSQKAAVKNKRFAIKLRKSKAVHVHFDDLITKEITKLKPLSVSVVVDADRRFILGAKVARIPSFGHLAAISRKKYGPRKSEHAEKLDELFKEVKPMISPFASIASDEHKNYAPVVSRYFPKSDYQQFKSERSCIAGQGELKKTKYDPIYYANHSLAMMRDHLAPLVRRTWCTTQDPKRLQGLLDIFICYYNQFYLGGLGP